MTKHFKTVTSEYYTTCKALLRVGVLCSELHPPTKPTLPTVSHSRMI